MGRNPKETSRESPGKYGALARDEENVVKAWDEHEPFVAVETSKPSSQSKETMFKEGGGKRTKYVRPVPPPGRPKPSFARRVFGFFFNNMWLVFLTYFFIAVVTMRHLNGEPDFDSLVNTIYFVAITATTVGYGDMYPKSQSGKIFVMVFIITGVAIAGVMMTKITGWILNKQEQALKKMEARATAEMQAELAQLKKNVGASFTESDATALKEKKKRRFNTMAAHPVTRALLAMTIVIITGAIVMYKLEGVSFLDGCYWSVVTSTTVGYGDISPKTRNGRIFATFYSFITVGVMGWAVGQVASASISESVEHGKEVKSFKLTPESLVRMGGAKGYVDPYDFTVAMLLAMGKATQQDFDMIASRFNELDVNNDRTLDAKDLLGE